MNKKLVIAVIVAMCACVSVFARPHGGPGFGGPRGGFHGGFGYRPAPVMRHSYHHHSHSFWGHGGRNFWPGFVGGVVGGVVGNAIAAPAPIVVASPTVVTPVVTPAPVVVQQPVVVQTQPTYTTQSVWVEGRYVDQVQANGTVIRVWQPGHYEQRQVVVQ